MWFSAENNLLIKYSSGQPRRDIRAQTRWCAAKRKLTKSDANRKGENKKRKKWNALKSTKRTEIPMGNKLNLNYIYLKSSEKQKERILQLNCYDSFFVSFCVRKTSTTFDTLFMRTYDDSSHSAFRCADGRAAKSNRKLSEREHYRYY